MPFSTIIVITDYSEECPGILRVQETGSPVIGHFGELALGIFICPRHTKVSQHTQAAINSDDGRKTQNEVHSCSPNSSCCSGTCHHGKVCKYKRENERKNGQTAPLCHHVSQNDSCILSQCLFCFLLLSTIQTSNGQSLRSAVRGKPTNCTLIKIHVLYPNGIPEGEEPPEAENNGWRCEDTWGTNGVYSLDGISSELIDSLDESDAGNTVLSISSAARVMHMPNVATIGASTS